MINFYSLVTSLKTHANLNDNEKNIAGRILLENFYGIQNSPTSSEKMVMDQLLGKSTVSTIFHVLQFAKRRNSEFILCIIIRRFTELFSRMKISELETSSP